MMRIALLALLALASCKASGSGEAGEGEAVLGLYDCSCDYLTDTDLTGLERVRVCAESDADARKRGRGCAQTHSPGSVNRCTCVHYATIDCPVNDCRLNR